MPGPNVWRIDSKEKKKKERHNEDGDLTFDTKTAVQSPDMVIPDESATTQIKSKHDSKISKQGKGSARKKLY